MSDAEVVAGYNYAHFTKENVLPWLSFDKSPPVGRKAPDFPLWHLDGNRTSLGELWAAHMYTIVEFGSFT